MLYVKIRFVKLLYVRMLDMSNIFNYTYKFDY